MLRWRDAPSPVSRWTGIFGMFQKPIRELGSPPIEVGLSMQAFSPISFHSDGDGVPPITAVPADDSYEARERR